MAGNIYGNGTTTATAGANTIVHYYDRAGINAANRVNVYQQWADRKSMPTKMGKTFKISRFEHMYDRSTESAEFAAKGYMTARSIDEVSAGLAGGTLGEGATGVNKQTLHKLTFETSLARYGKMIDYTDEVDLFSEDYINVKYREELGELANADMEDLCQLEMLSTSTVMYSGAATSMSTIGTSIAANGSDDSDFKVSYDLIRKATRKLFRNRAKKNTSIVTGSTKIGTTPIAKAYYAIIGADVKADLEATSRGTVSENGFTEFVYIPAHKYAGASTLAEGEVGAMHEVRFVEAESAVVYRGAGASIPSGYTGSLQYTSFSGASDNKLFTNGTAGALNVTGTTSTGGTITISVPANGTAVGPDKDVNGNAYTYGAVVGITATEPALGKFDVFPILFPTEGAFATVGLKGNEKIKFNSKSPSEIDSGNTYGTTGFFSFNFWYAGILLREEAMLKLLVGASV